MMFNELPVSGPSRRPTRTRWTVLLSLLGELTVVAVLLLIPLIHTQALPFHWLNTSILPAPPPAPVDRIHLQTPVTTVRGTTKFSIPTAIPRHARVIPDTGPAPQASAPQISDGIPGGTGNTPNPLLSGTGTPPSPPPVARPPSRIIRGGDVQAARLIKFVRPFYPPVARAARLEGTVVLQAIIGADGSVKALHAVSGSALLIPAAINAVAQWRYRPTFLNGTPVEVQTTITVVFKLHQ